MSVGGIHAVVWIYITHTVLGGLRERPRVRGERVACTAFVLYGLDVTVEEPTGFGVLIFRWCGLKWMEVVVCTHFKPFV